MTEQGGGKSDLSSAFSAEITPLSNGSISRFRILDAGAPLSWADVVDRWRNDQLFRSFYISLLVECPYPAYFWEMPPVTDLTFNREFEFVLVDSPRLTSIHSQQQAFANQFASAESRASVIEFSNLGGDATLVVPRPGEPLSAYSQIATFSRHAPDDQQHQLWAMVGAALERRLGKQPVWASTSGLGVYWLHIRLDSTPKYYTYAPYRNR